MKNWKKTIMLAVVAMTVSMPVLAFTDMKVNSEAKKSEKVSFMCPKCESEHKDFKDLKSEEMKNKKLELVTLENNTILKADSMVPGIKTQWEEVIKERKEIIKQIMEMEKNRKPDKELPRTQSKEFKNISDGSMKTVWDNFSKAVEANNKDEIKETFNKFIAFNKEINELLKQKLDKLQ